MKLRQIKEFLCMPVVRNMITNKLCLNYRMQFIACGIGKELKYAGHVSEDLGLILTKYNHAPYVNRIIADSITRSQP